MRWAAAAMVLFSGCTALPPAGTPVATRTESAVDGPWAELETSPEFSIRQRLRYEVGDSSRTFDTIVQVVCGTLTVVGLTPLGTRFFSVRQYRDAVDIYPVAEEDWPFPPDRLLLDIHRTLLYPLTVPAPDNGPHLYEYGGVMVRERWHDGRLVERIVPTSFPAEDGDLWVLYEGGIAPGRMPKTIRLQNDRYGYKLTLELLEVRELECPKHAPAVRRAVRENDQRGGGK